MARVHHTARRCSGRLAARGARTQQSARPVIGFLCRTPAAPFAHLVTAFHDGLKDAGLVEGQNVAIDALLGLPHN